MGYFKLDKLDKIVISLIFIVVSMFSIFNCFCFATEEISGVEISNVSPSFSSDNPVFVNRPGANAVYFNVIPGHKYAYYFDYQTSFCYSYDEPSIGVNYYDIIYPNSSPYEFVAEADYLFLFVGSSSNPVNLETVRLVDITPSGFASVIGNLSLNVGLSQLWNVFETSIPWILVVVLFVFGWWFFSHWVKELGKGREF